MSTHCCPKPSRAPQKHRFGKIFLSLAGGVVLARLLRWVGTHDLDDSTSRPHHGGLSDAKSCDAETNRIVPRAPDTSDPHGLTSR